MVGRYIKGSCARVKAFYLTSWLGGSCQRNFQQGIKRFVTERDKRLLDGGVGALPRVLEAYMGEVVWPHPPGAKRQGLHGHWPEVRA